MDHVNCNLCNLDDPKILFKKKDKFGITEDEFNVVECRRCGLIYVSPRPNDEEIGKFYPDTYAWKEILQADSVPTKFVRRLEKGYRYHLLKDQTLKVLKFTERSTGKVLDIGCGTGDRLDVFRSKGFETYGVEISDSADYAKEQLKLNVLKRDLFSANFPNKYFDIITLYHVLEHTYNPLKVCEEIHRILKEDGFLVIQVPNKESFQYKLFRKRWAAFDVPRDLYYFGTKTLSSLLKKVGFKVLKVDHMMNWWHPPTLVLSLFPCLDPQKAWAKEGRGGNTFFQRIAWILCTFFAVPFTHIESCVKRGAIVTFYAIKQFPST